MNVMEEIFIKLYTNFGELYQNRYNWSVYA